MKNFILAGLFLVVGFCVKAQRIDSIYVNLYTDSLKKGTYNYINVDGLLSDGNYLPLDSTHLIFTSNYGQFYGNTLWIEDTMHTGRVDINICLRRNYGIKKAFSMYIKQQADPPLKTEEEIIADLKKNSGKKKKN